MPFPEVPMARSSAQRRLVYLASRRAMAEMERILHRFLVRELTELDDGQCQRLESLLNRADADLMDWMAGLKPMPDDLEADLLARLMVHSREEGMAVGE
ncbi:MAG: succinate dehydrogenase assembly factor 2 [Magnetococcales bacterium]|nr:succinate dehydrogenase assembly factor 2 [Magnetococcales bacterium]